MPADFLEVDDLDPRRPLGRASSTAPRPASSPPTAMLRRCSPAGASPCCSRSRRPGPATPPRWPSSSSAATPSPSAARRSASTCARPSRTSPGRSPATAPPSAPGSSTTPSSSAMAAAVDIPVVNLLSDRRPPVPGARRPAHPARALRRLEGRHRRLRRRRQQRRRVARLRARPCAASSSRIASPAGYALDDAVVDRARNLGGTIELTTDPDEAVARRRRGLHRRLDLDGPGGRDRAAGAPRSPATRSTTRSWPAAGPDACFLHCLPAHRGEEVAADVIDGPQQPVWQQAANRMHATRALLAELGPER